MLKLNNNFSALEFELGICKNGYTIKKYWGFGEENFYVPGKIDGKEIIEISEEAFKGCRKIKNLTISGKIKNIGKKAFESCLDLETLTFEDGTETIESGAFADCSSLASINFSKTLKRFGNHNTLDELPSHGERGVFENTAINSLDMPDNILSIGDK